MIDSSLPDSIRHFWVTLRNAVARASVSMVPSTSHPVRKVVLSKSLSKRVSGKDAWVSGANESIKQTVVEVAEITKAKMERRVAFRHITCVSGLSSISLKCLLAGALITRGYLTVPYSNPTPA